MGSVHPYTTASGEERFRIVYRDASNRQTTKRGFKGSREAKKALNRIETEIADGDYIPSSRGRKPLGELAKAWLTTKEATLKRSSYAAIEASWRTHVEPKFGATAVAKITHEDVQKWINNLDRSATTKRRAAEVLAGVLDGAVPKLIKENPARKITLPSKTTGKAHRYLTHQQLWALAETAGDRKALILVLGYCGIRWGELTALRVENLDVERQRLRIEKNVVQVGSNLVEGTPKSHKVRAVPVPTVVWDLLLEQCEDQNVEDIVFDNGHGAYLIPPTGGARARSWWNSALKQAGLRYMPIHDLRHTAASLAVKSGAHVKIVQRMLGHASAAITLDVYADLFEDDLDTLRDRLDSDIAAAIVVSPVVTDTEAA